MANVSQSLVERFFDTLGTAAQEVVNSSPSDLTIDAEIVSVVNIGIGEYKVNYQGNLISAYNETEGVTYKIGERVYILVPQGDMSRKKIIYGRSSYMNTGALENLNAVKNFYVDQGPDWISQYGLSSDLSICACPGARVSELVAPARYFHYSIGHPEVAADKIITPEDARKELEPSTNTRNIDSQFAAWGQAHEYLKIQGVFQTQFSGIHNFGRYSLQVRCLQTNPRYVADTTAPDYDEDEPQYNIVTYELGFSDFTGASPYYVNEPSLQKAYFLVPTGGIVGIHSIALVQDGDMQFDIPQTYDANGLPQYNPADAVKNINNITVSGIQVSFAKKVNLSDTMYYPYIEAPYGVNLYAAPDESTPGRASVQLIAHLQYGDIDITNQEGCRIHWFRQKADITESSAAAEEPDEFGKTYFDYGGPGWYPVDRIQKEQQPYATDSKTMYAVDGNKLTVYLDAVPWRWKYKAVMTYSVKETNPADGQEYVREINQTYAIQEVIRSDSIYDLSLKPYLDDLPGYYEIDNAKDLVKEKPWIGTWYAKALDDSYNRISNPFHEGKLNILENPFSAWSVISVQCYDPYDYRTGATNSTAYEVGIVEMQVGSKSEVPFIVDWEGDDFFQYDAQGCWKGEKDPKTYVLTPVIRFAEGCACNYSIRVEAPDHKVLGDYDYYRDASKVESEAFHCWTNDDFMVTDAYIDRYYGIHYSVSDKYDKEKAKNNIFTITIYTDDLKQYTFTKQIEFRKSGDLGVNGTEWSVRLRPCKWKASSQEGLFVEPYSDEHPYPLVVRRDSDGYTAQDENFRLFLRPYVTRGGTLLEELDKEQAFFYRCSWDVRTPGSDALIESARLSSFLRLHHAQRAEGEPCTAKRGAAFDITDGGAWETGSDVLKVDDSSEGIRVNPIDRENESIDGLVAHTVYPLSPEADLWKGEGENPFTKSLNECYGAVEVCYFDNEHDGTKATLEQCQYRFIVKCTVDILQGSYDYGGRKIETSAYARRVSSIVCYYPVDVFFCDDDAPVPSPEQFRRSLVTNWPTTVKYDTLGYNPEHADEILHFSIDDGEDIHAYNLTPNVLTLAKTNITREDPSDLSSKIVSFDYKFRPVSHLSKQDGYHGALRTEFEAWPWRDEKDEGYNCYFLRNIVMYYNRFGNADINGWDGQGLDTNEENGTVFGVTFGAGWKGEFSNAFTGVLMGVDKNMPRKDYQEDVSSLEYPEEAEESHPYLTGLFGYQEGIQSFGLLENGTAFFGRADRGGRIIIDGSNATIYGGANGAFTSPSISDPMWNTLRINLVDLNHTKDGELWALDPNIEGSTTFERAGVPSGYKVRNTNGDPVSLDMGGRSFGFPKDNDENNSAEMVPTWYAKMWRNAYLQPTGAKPYWLIRTKDAKTGSTKTYEYDNLGRWDGKDLPPVVDENDPNNNKKINYFDNYWVSLNTKEIKELYGNDPEFPEFPSDSDLNEYERFPYLPLKDETGIKIDGQTIPTVFVYNEETNKIEANSDYEGVLAKRLAFLRDKGYKMPLSSFGSQRASTTPAIEIGQHIPGLRPGLIDWHDYDALYKNQRVPGDRNFLVTYDGTLWAMNGVFMGNVIGANIIGGRIQASQIGVGPNSDSAISGNIYTVFADGAQYKCQWANLDPPHDAETLADIYPSSVTGYAMTLDENGITTFGGEVIGGSIDIGHFHIIGYKTIDRLKNLGKWGSSSEDKELGHLIQTGQSDFIGQTHFYGNIGIAPDVDKLFSDSGSLVQVSGFTALGVLLPAKTDPRSHETVPNLSSHQMIDNYINGDNIKFYSEDVTSSEIGEGGSVEQSAVFAIDSRGPRGIYSNLDNPEGIRGHFWPLHFHAKRNVPNDGGSPIVDSYVTMMDQFKSLGTGKYGDNGGDYPTSFDGSNYFRISRWGIEGQEFFIRNRFQPESKSSEPAPDKSEEESYRGYMGSVARGGYGDGSTTAPDIGALGITTWNNNAIILRSDDNLASMNRRSAYFYANTQSNVSPTRTWTEQDNSYGKDCNLTIQLDSSLSPNDTNTKTYGTMQLKTVGSPIGMAVLKPKDRSNPSFGDNLFSSVAARSTGNTNHKVGSVLMMNPYAGDVNYLNGTLAGDIDKQAATLLAGTSGADGKGGVHIFCYNDNTNMLSEDCRKTKFSETFWGEKEIRSWANNKNGMYSEMNVVLGITDSNVHSIPETITKGLIMTGNKLQIVGYEASQQEGIYARFG